MGDDRRLLLWPDGDLSCAPERWIRSGECVRCGACCKDEDRPHYLVGVLDDADGDAVDADGDAVDADRDTVVYGGDPLRASQGTRGVSGSAGVEVDEGDAPAEPDVGPESASGQLPPGPVVAEDWDGQWVFWRQSGARYGPCPKWRGGGECAVYGEEDFPHVCRKWPVLPSEMKSYPTCGFSFRRSGDDPSS
jgi:hypothetical protein